MNNRFICIYVLCVFILIIATEGADDDIISPVAKYFTAEVAEAANFTYKQAYFGHHLHFNKKDRKIEFRCHDLFKSALNSGMNVSWPPPTTPPKDLEPLFLFGNSIALQNMYFAERQNGAEENYDWKKSDIDELGKHESTCAYYQTPVCADTFRRYQKYIKGKSGLVFGSQTPWAEAALLAKGAQQVATVEYRKIVTDHPNLVTYHPSEVAKKFIANTLELADFAFSYSSFEHDGLGRYGDPIIPHADLESIARVYCMLKPGGIFFLGFPMGPDVTVWNAHRIYGKFRLFPILSSWEVIDVLGIGEAPQPLSKVPLPPHLLQPIMVLRKKEISA